MLSPRLTQQDKQKKPEGDEEGGAGVRNDVLWLEGGYTGLCGGSWCGMECGGTVWKADRGRER